MVPVGPLQMKSEVTDITGKLAKGCVGFMNGIAKVFQKEHKQGNEKIEKVERPTMKRKC